MSDDLIRRSDAIKTINKALDRETLLYSWVRKIAVDAIRSTPSADRPQGEWLEVTSWEAEHHSVTDMRCSICGKYASLVLPHKTRCLYDFCPFCGAKMKGADDESQS